MVSTKGRASATRWMPEAIGAARRWRRESRSGEGLAMGDRGNGIYISGGAILVILIIILLIWLL